VGGGWADLENIMWALLYNALISADHNFELIVGFYAAIIAGRSTS